MGPGQELSPHTGVGSVHAHHSDPSKKAGQPAALVSLVSLMTAQVLLARAWLKVRPLSTDCRQQRMTNGNV